MADPVVLGQLHHKALLPQVRYRALKEEASQQMGFF